MDQTGGTNDVRDRGPLYVRWCKVCGEFRNASPADTECPVCGSMFIRNRCFRCGHEWIQRKDSTPGTCPRCRSPFWNRRYMKPDQSRKQKLW